MAKKRGHGKYSGEVERIKMLGSLNEMMKTSDMENALLSNSARDSETVSDSVVDDMLSKINIERGKDIQTVERMTAYSTTQARTPKRAARSPPRKRKAKPARRHKPIRKRKAKKSRKMGKPKRRR